MSDNVKEALEIKDDEIKKIIQKMKEILKNKDKNDEKIKILDDHLNKVYQEKSLKFKKILETNDKNDEKIKILDKDSKQRDIYILKNIAISLRLNIGSCGNYNDITALMNYIIDLYLEELEKKELEERKPEDLDF